MTGLEPAASCVTGRRSNQLSYYPKRKGDHIFFYRMSQAKVQEKLHQFVFFSLNRRFLQQIV